MKYYFWTKYDRKLFVTTSKQKQSYKAKQLQKNEKTKSFLQEKLEQIKHILKYNTQIYKKYCAVKEFINIVK